MGICGNKNRGHNGFTITEVLIVITVIGILAGIVIFAFPGYQQKNRDDRRKSDVQQIAAALSAYALQKNTFVGSDSGCGASGHGNGWVNAGPNASYPKSILTCLKDVGVLKNDVLDPSGCVSDTGGACGTSGSSPTTAYMKATCTKGGGSVTYVFARLEQLPRKDSEVDALCDDGSVEGFSAATQKWGTNYGMNYYVAVR